MLRPCASPPGSLPNLRYVDSSPLATCTRTQILAVMHGVDVACMETGELVCFASDCCIREESGDKLFECFSHADRCHAGTGTYVILKSSMVFSLFLVFLVLASLASHVLCP